MADFWEDFLGRQLLPALAFLPSAVQTCDQSPKLFLSESPQTSGLS